MRSRFEKHYVKNIGACDNGAFKYIREQYIEVELIRAIERAKNNEKRLLSQNLQTIYEFPMELGTFYRYASLVGVPY